MKSRLLVVVVLVLLGVVRVMANVLRRVLYIQAASRAGTAFTSEVDGDQYSVTAKRLLRELKDEGTTFIPKNDSRSSSKVKNFSRRTIRSWCRLAGSEPAPSA
jgi:F0F1-type ATP synthase assembly protein I